MELYPYIYINAFFSRQLHSVRWIQTNDNEGRVFENLHVRSSGVGGEGVAQEVHAGRRVSNPIVIPSDRNLECIFRSFSTRYFESNLPQPSNNSRIDAKSKDTNDRLRFGIPIAASYGNTGTGVNYGNSNGVGYMISPMKIDIGGVALGALIGLGAILVVPKLAHIFSGGYGYRSKETATLSL